MKNKKTIKQNSYIKHYTNKLLLILATFFILLGVANAGTISDSSGVLTYDSVNICMTDGSTQFTGNVNFGGNELQNIQNIGTEYFVKTGNGSHLLEQIKLSEANGGGIVIIPVGDYIVSETITLTNSTILYGHGVSTISGLGVNIMPEDNFNLIEFHSGFSSVQNLRLYTYGISGYNSSVVSFSSDYTEASNYPVLLNVLISGRTNEGKAISLIDNSSTSHGISWLLIQNVRIYGYRYGLYMETDNALAYIKGNKFDNIFCAETYICLYQNNILGNFGGIGGNTYNMRANGNSLSHSFAHIEAGEGDVINSVIYDGQDYNSSFVYNITNKSSNSKINDNLLANQYIINNGINTELRLRDYNNYNDKTNFQNKINVNSEINIKNLEDNTPGINTTLSIINFTSDDSSGSWVGGESRGFLSFFSVDDYGGNTGFKITTSDSSQNYYDSLIIDNYGKAKFKSTLTVLGDFKANNYFADDGTQGMTGSCASGTTLTIKDGLVTACS